MQIQQVKTQDATVQEMLETRTTQLDLTQSALQKEQQKLVQLVKESQPQSVQEIQSQIDTLKRENEQLKITLRHRELDNNENEAKIATLKANIK